MKKKVKSNIAPVILLAALLVFAFIAARPRLQQGSFWNQVRKTAKQAGNAGQQELDRRRAEAERRVREAAQQAERVLQQSRRSSPAPAPFSPRADRTVRQLERIATTFLESVNITPETVRREVERLRGLGAFERTLIQSPASPKFKVLIVGNGLEKASLESYCQKVMRGLGATQPYAKFSGDIEWSCGRYPFTVEGVTASSRLFYAATAELFLLANAQRLALGYDQAIILQNSAGRSWAVPPFSSAIVFLKKDTGAFHADDDIIRTFNHEFGHSFACLADEYVNPDDLKAGNEIMKLLGFPEARSQIDTLLTACLSVPNCVYKSGKSCPSGWFEGCALVPTGTCRPSFDSAMRFGSEFNEPSKKRIEEAAAGKPVLRREFRIVR